MTRLVWTLPDGLQTARWAEDEGGGGGSQPASEIIAVDWSGTMVDCRKTSDGLTPQFADFTVDYQKGTDLSLVEYEHEAGAAAFSSAAGGSFGVSTYISARLTADAGSAVQRFIQFYNASLFGDGIPDLGGDALLPLIDAYACDNLATALPYFDVDAEQHFGKPVFNGAAGTVADSVALYIVMTCWSL